MDINGIVIRPAQHEDVPAILDIYNEAVLNTTASYDYEPSTLAAREAWFDAHAKQQHPIFVAVESGRILGWSSLSEFRSRIGYRFTAENSVYVAPDCRGHGIGARLMPPLIDSARQLGLHAIIAAIDAENDASLRLHARFGFETVAMLKQVGYKFGRWLDVVYMELLLKNDAQGNTV
jgi:phosphinothricin acetyltransferase